MRLDARQLTRWRLRSLGLSGPPRSRPVDVAAHLLAVQSQDHGPSCWAIGQRTRRPAAADVDRAFERGELLRVHVLRPTWHTVAADDVRWLVALTAPRVHLINAGPHREEGLLPELLGRAVNVVSAALADGRPRTRPEVGALLADAGIEASTRRLSYVMMHLELVGLVCSGPLRGVHHTYALVADRAPGARDLDREEALAELARRYATSHGPVTPHDLATWSSLTLEDARRGLDAAALTEVDVEGVAHWHPPSQSLPRASSTPRWRLLQLYDELVVGYRHSGHVLGSEARMLAQKRAEPQAIVMRDEQVVGRWRRTLVGVDGVRVEVLLRGAPPEPGLTEAVAAHAAFLGRAPELVLL